MVTALDPIGNLVGHYPGASADAPCVLIGSHIDSVRDAGRYDGPLGVMLGIECVASLAAQGRHLPFAIKVAAFGDEEGSRFPAAMLTSRAMAGTLAAAALDIADGDGVSLAKAMADFGLDAAGALSAHLQPAPIAYLEAHIEQGPVLEAEGLALGTVTGIAAQSRYEVRVTGRAGHAGTTAMNLRADAMAGAAEMVLAIEAIAAADASDLASDLVGTVGRLVTHPGATNVIAGRVDFTIDVRAGTSNRRDVAAAAMVEAIARIAAKRGLGITTAQTHKQPASPCDAGLTDLMDRAIAAQGITPRRLVSGAGHDASVMAALCPTAMVFIRCKGGISHNPAESVTVADTEAALAAMLTFLEMLGETRG